MENKDSIDEKLDKLTALIVERDRKIEVQGELIEAQKEHIKALEDAYEAAKDLIKKLRAIWNQ